MVRSARRSGWTSHCRQAASLANGPASIGQTEVAHSGRLRGGSPSVELEVGGYYDVFLLGHTLVGGFCIPSGTPWRGAGYIYYSGFGSELPEGEPTYLGVRFDPGDGLRYGWLGVVREDTGLEPFAWGYETEAGVAICFWPDPGTLSLLAFGAAAVTARRR